MPEKLILPTGASEFRAPQTGLERPKIGISSDDGPNKSNIEVVLGILKDNAVRATFFWIVENAERFRSSDSQFFSEIMYGIGDNGHEIGFHAPKDYIPTRMSRLTSRFSLGEMRQGVFDLEGLTGMEVNYFRPHYAIQPLAFLYAKMLGLKSPDLPFPDLKHYADPMAPVEEQIKKFSGAKPGGIIIFHDGISMTRPETNALGAMPSVFANLRARGLEPTSISGLTQR